MQYFLLWLVLPLWYKNCKKTCYKFFAIISIALLPSSRFNLHVYLRLFCQTTIIEMPSLIRKEKVTCENCGNQITRNNIVRHKKRCSVGTLYCTQCPNFSTKSQNDLKYHIAKKHKPQNLKSSSIVNFVLQNFLAFMLYVNIEALNTERRPDREQKMWIWNI